jgi:hypothetical protein
MIRVLMGWFGRLFGTPRLWAPSCRYLIQWPSARPGKTGIAAARRKARKLRNRRRARGA